ncbi:YceD family protein [Chitinilyticum litopenaei]|uniref:YceD family protein n=1 Tax=Chitinilyticum litopenaei TaxID=1121276 RepID=UPI001FDED007|nr:YceD family protein [Chitinilyticum litopenaei]
MSVINSAEFAIAREQLAGKVAVASLPRLADAVLDHAAELVWSLEGGVDKLERPYLFLQVSGELQLRCQRCLKAMPFQLACETVLTQFADEALLDEAEEADEDLEGLLIDPALDVLALVEEEVLLALPYAPRHDRCDADDVMIVSDKPNPFAVLAQLKTRKAE